MAYVKTWANDETLNRTEKQKLKKDGLKIFNDIPKYAKEGFASIPKEEWDLFKWAGLYLQKPKEAGFFMMRVNIPSGIITNEQLVTLASIAKDYGCGVFDITTRQAIQFHWLTIEQVPDILNQLEKVGLSSAGACGDIPRTITGNPLAGIDKDELFDTREVVREIYEFFQRNEDFSNLPRKYKISINANIYNPAHAEINCLAFIPATKVIDGKEEVGFHVKVGGGLSARPFLAQELDIFVRPEEAKKVAIAITTLYRDHGYRKKRHHSRLKFLVADWGVDTFKEKLTELIGPLESKGKSAVKEWNAGYFYGVHEQKQPGLYYLGFNVPVGRLQADEVFELARIAKKYGNGEIRTCSSQNLIIPNVKKENLDALQNEKIFQRISLKPNRFIGYSVSCTGSEYCNLALVETKERMKNIATYLDKYLEVDVPVRIHMIGCPNSCGQRQIADIGLQGIKLRDENRKLIEGYELYVGGTLNDGGAYNEKLKGKIPHYYLTDVLVRLLTYFKAEKKLGEDFYTFVKRTGIGELQRVFTSILETTDQKIEW